MGFVRGGNLKRQIQGMFYIGLFISLLLVVGCSTSNTAVTSSVQEISMNNTQVEDKQQDTSQSIDSQDTKDKMIIHVENNKGKVETVNDNLADLLMNSVGKIEGKPQILTSKDFEGKIASACPYDNEVSITKNNVELCRFWITGDSCNAVLKQDYSIIELSNEVHSELEKVMKKNHNSLYEHKRYNS